MKRFWAMVPALTLLLLMARPLPAAPVPVPQAAPPSGPAQAPLIEARDNRLTVQLDMVRWPIILQELHRQTGLIIRVQGQLSGKVTHAFDALPMEQGLRRLLRGTNHIFLYQGTGQGRGEAASLAEVWIFPPARSTTDRAGEQSAPRQQQAEVQGGTSRQDPLSGATGQTKVARAPHEPREPPALRMREALLELLQDPDPRVRERAVEVLTDARDHAAVERLGQVLLDDADVDVRESAAIALWKIGGLQAMEALERATADEEEDIREIAEGALESLQQGVQPR